MVALAAALSNPCWEAKRLLGLTPDSANDDTDSD
jgi:hypothetical protein